MTASQPEYLESHRRQWWGWARRLWERTAVQLSMMSVGLLGGAWLTRDWASDSDAAWVVALCVGGAYVTGELGWRLVKGPPASPEPPKLVRTPVRGEIAVVVSPRHRDGGSAVWWAGGVGYLAVVTSSSVLDVIGPASAAYRRCWSAWH